MQFSPACSMKTTKSGRTRDKLPTITKIPPGPPFCAGEESLSIAVAETMIKAEKSIKWGKLIGVYADNFLLSQLTVGYYDFN